MPFLDYTGLTYYDGKIKTYIGTEVSPKVSGPASSTANHVATFDGTTGKLIKDSGYTIEASVPSNAVFTDTVTTVSDSLSDTSTTKALSAAKGKALNDNKLGKGATWGALAGASGY